MIKTNNRLLRIWYLNILILTLIFLTSCSGEINEKEFEQNKIAIEEKLSNDSIAQYIQDVQWELVSKEYTYKDGIKLLEYGHYYYQLRIYTDNQLYSEIEGYSPYFLYDDIIKTLSNTIGVVTLSEENIINLSCGWSTSCDVEILFNDEELTLN